MKAALSAMTVKTDDRKDARGIAQLLRMGWLRPVHRKSPDAQEVRALLVGRKLLQGKLRAIEQSIRGILRGFFGLKVGEVSKGRFAAKVVGELITGHERLAAVVGAMKAREGLPMEFMRRHRRMLAIGRGDEVGRRRLMTVPGVGALVAVTFQSGGRRSAGRCSSSKAVGAHCGLTPKRDPSGATDVTDVTGGISKVGDAMLVRTALYEAAHVMLSRTTRFSALKRWGAMEVARRRGLKRAKVAALAAQVGQRPASPVGGRHGLPLGQ